MQSISDRNRPEGHGCGQRRGGLKMPSPSTPGNILALPSHLCVCMHFVCSCMHFFGSSKKSIKSRDERTSKKPYALYAPLLGVGVFSAFFLLREVHTAAYGSHRNQALALLPVGIGGAFPACENQKCIRIRIRISADSRRNRPSMKSIRLRPSSSPADAQAVFAPKNDSLAPLRGFRPFGG